MPSRHPNRVAAKSENKKPINCQRAETAVSPLVVVVGSVGRRSSLRNAASVASRTSSKKSLVQCAVKILKTPVRIDKQPLLVQPDNENCCNKKHFRNRISEKNIKSSKMISRTNLKQQLMREHTEQLLKKEKELSPSSPALSTSAIRVPIYSSPSPVQIPKQVLMVKSKLENPTPYHVQQSQQRQVHEFLTHSHHVGRSAPLLPNSADESQNVLPVAASDPTPISPELEAFWQDFGNLHAASSIADSGVDPSLNTSVSATDAAILDVLSMFPAVENVSASCPAELGDVEEEIEIDSFTEEKLQVLQRDRQKKDNHNRIERRRRFNINDRIKELGTLLPGNGDPYYDLVKDIRHNKGTILKATVDYVRCLKNEVKKIPKLQCRIRTTEQLNRKLLLRIQALELELKSHDIPLSQSTWYPSSESDLNAIIKQEPELIYDDSQPNEMAGPPSARPKASLPENQHLEHMELLKKIKSAPSHGPRTGQPIMQFLTVKHEPAMHTTSPASSTPSPGLFCSSPTPVFSRFEDLMMDDDQPVKGDPMLSARESFSPENMDFVQ